MFSYYSNVVKNTPKTKKINLNTFFKTPRNQNSGGLTKMKDEFKLLAKKSKHEEEENEEDSDDDDKDDDDGGDDE